MPTCHLIKKDYKPKGLFVRKLLLIFFFFSSTDDSCQYWVNKTTLTSPYYPKYFLADHVGCEWILTAPKGHIIALEFEYFSVSISKKYYRGSLRYVDPSASTVFHGTNLHSPIF